ncbi:beta strand repeat-containing protein [Flavobacterium sp.]|jgi:hypothetical protein|uniref:beta strand repeat-containing protein n=1 Tax=Flavobacterium sp. TaxID=239 RepID=UPI0037C0F14F
MKNKYPRNIIWLLIVMLITISNAIYSQSSSFGNTYIFNDGEMGIVDIQHNFFNGGSGIQPGIVGTDRTSTQGFLSFVGTASWTGASNSAFVDGYVKSYLTTAFIFPIGDNNKYRPAAVSAASLANPSNAAYYGVSAATAITSRLRGGNEPILPTGGPYNTSLMGTGVGSVNNVEYWDINGTTSAKITLTWDANSAITSLSSLSILGWNGTQWVAIASTVDSTSLIGGSSTLTTGSITTNANLVPDNYSVYTLGTICNAGTTAPVVSSNTITNTCPTTTVNLNSLVTSNTPSGTSIVWFTNNNHTGSAYATPTTAVAGTYYPFYYDSVNSCYSPVGAMVTVTITLPPDIPTIASTTQPTCIVATGSIIFSVQSGVEYSVDNGLNFQTSPTFTGLAAGTYNLIVRNSTNTTCSAVLPNSVTLYAPSITSPNLIVSGAICNGTTYNVSFNSNGLVTASAGNIVGNTITEVPIGTNLVLTSTSINGCSSIQSTVVSPSSCGIPPAGCVTPTISAGTGVCSGSGTYSVSVTASLGAIITSDTGTVFGNSVTGIALGTSVTITATNGICTNSLIVSSPSDCTIPCATSSVSYSIGSCLGTTYNVSISNPNSVNITSSVGTVGSNAVTGIPIGTNVTLTATASGCTPEVVNLIAPSATTPSLIISGATCNGNTYNVNFNSNGVVSASAGNIVGNTITGVPVGTDLVLISNSINGCASTQSTVLSPASCSNPPTGCITPTISAGSGVCSGSGTYSVSVSTSVGAIISSSVGTVIGNSVTGISIGSPVTIIATIGSCTNSVIVSSPSDCSTQCATSSVSYSIGSCLGSTYNIYINNPNGSNITSSGGTINASVITNIPIGINVTITATATGCIPQMVTLSSPVGCSPDFTPTVDIDNVVFLTAGVSRDFVVNISETRSSPSNGQIIFIIPKQSGFTITYNPLNVLSAVGGGTVVNNSDWNFTENSFFITVTSKPNVVVDSYSFSSIGFEIFRKPNIPNQTWQPITITILNGSGSDSVDDNNTYNLIIKTQ